MSEFLYPSGRLLPHRFRSTLSAAGGRLAEFVHGRESDEAIVSAVLRSNDPSLFSLIVTRYRHKLTALARTTLAGSPAESETDDVVQDTFVSAYDHLLTFRKDAKFRPWLYKILLNRCYDRLRSARSVSFLKEDEQQSTSERSPLETVLANDTAQRIDRAVQTLTPGMRSLFLLRHMDNLTYAELADITGQPVGTVKTNLFRARVRIRELIKEEDS